MLGASGFVGRSLSAALSNGGHDVRKLSAPRLIGRHDLANRSTSTVVTSLAERIAGSEILVNCAGLPKTKARAAALTGANVTLPLLVAEACRASAIDRFIHVSSAAVQGYGQLDESTCQRPFSPYSETKAEAERLLLSLYGAITTIFRATSIHGADRPMTRRLIRLASSGRLPFAVEAPTPQVHVDNLGAALAFCAVSPISPPEIVLQPADGFTTASFLTLLGGKPPPRLSPSFARSLIAVGRTIPSTTIRVAARRAHLLLFGQGQTSSWLQEQGWEAPAGRLQWQSLVLHAQDAQSDGCHPAGRRAVDLSHDRSDGHARGRS